MTPLNDLLRMELNLPLNASWPDVAQAAKNFLAGKSSPGPQTRLWLMSVLDDWIVHESDPDALVLWARYGSDEQ